MLLSAWICFVNCQRIGPGTFVDGMKYGAMNILLLFVCVCAIGLACIVLFRNLFFVATVSGLSMLPTLEQGDRLLVLRTWGKGRRKKGQVVVLRNPDPAMRTPSLGHIAVVKRIVALEGEVYTISPDDSALARGQNAVAQQIWAIPSGQVFVCGDNPKASRDSRMWGPLPLRSIQGVVLCKLQRKAPVAPPNTENPLTFLSQGQQAPDFLLTSTSGEVLSLQRFHGQQLLLLFTRYHRVARSELPTLLSQAAMIVNKGIAFVIVCGEPLERVRLMQEELQIAYPVLVAPPDQSTLYQEYQIKGTPCYYLIDEQGCIADAGVSHAFSARWKQLCEEDGP